MNNAKPVLFVLTAIITLYLMMHRYEFYPGDHSTTAYMLDRWTGSLEYITHDKRSPVEYAKPAK